jgi:hypothetical protein
MKKLGFASSVAESKTPPEYLHIMRRKKLKVDIPSPIEIYKQVIKYLEPTDCLSLIPSMLISDYAMAKYYLLCSQAELAFAPTVVKSKEVDVVKGTAEVYEITDFAEAMLKLQKNVHACWSPIWDIVSRNCERLIEDPEQEMLMIMLGGRKRRTPKGDKQQ